MIRSSLFALALALGSAPVLAQNTPAGDAPSKEAKAEAPKPNPDQVKASVEEDAQPVRRSIPLRGTDPRLHRRRPGHLTIRNDEGEPTASMFYVAYTVPSAGRPRPVTFLFNGGPGSSTMWLHMGSFGPMKVDASMPETIAGPPFRYGANPDTLARHHRPGVHRRADHRPVAAARQGRAEGFLRGRQGPRRLHPDDPALPDQIRPLEHAQVHHRRKLRHDARRRPVARAARQGRPAQRHRLRLDRLQFADFQGDQSLVNFLPTYAADAWYHGKIATSRPLEQFSGRRQRLRQRALCRGAAEGECAQRRGEAVGRPADGAADRRSRADYILRSNLRVEPDRFRRELLRDRHQIIGRIDSRYVGTEADNAGDGHRATTRRRARSPAPSSARSTTICSATSATRRRSPTGRTIMPGSTASRTAGTSSTRRPTATSRSPTPASISPMRCARTRG